MPHRAAHAIEDSNGPAAEGLDVPAAWFDQIVIQLVVNDILKIVWMGY